MSMLAGATTFAYDTVGTSSASSPFLDGNANQVEYRYGQDNSDYQCLPKRTSHIQILEAT